MSARPFASGTIAFGLVTIPVKLYSTGESSAGIQFNMLHRKCGSRLKQQYICPVDDEVVEKDAIAKGYEYSKGQYGADPGGARPYRLLAEAMKETGRAALARYVARGKDQLVLLRPYQNGLVMQQLRYADELRDFSEIPVGPEGVKEPELKLAIQLIEQVAAEEFHPENYEDKQRQQVRDLIERKVKGEEITAAPAEAPKAQVIDLMAALKASLAASKTSASEEPVSLAGRKPAKRSSGTTLTAVPGGAGESKKKSSRR
jgi:DNA end-binding protein Ku